MQSGKPGDEPLNSCVVVYIWTQAAERGVSVHGESSGGGRRVPASAVVVVSSIADAAYNSHAAAGWRRLSAAGDDGRHNLSTRNHPMSQHLAEGFLHVICLQSLRPTLALNLQTHFHPYFNGYCTHPNLSQCQFIFIR